MKREEVIEYCKDQWVATAIPNTNFTFYDAYMMGVRTCLEHVEFLKSCEVVCDYETERKKQIEKLTYRFEEEKERYKQENDEIRVYNHMLEHENDVLKAKVQMVELLFGGRN